MWLRCILRANCSSNWNRPKTRIRTATKPEPMPLAQRYTAVAISLHWLIAAAILANIALGLWMGAAINSASTQAGAVSVFQFHKSLGLTVLVLSLLRLAWRLLYPPSQPVSMAP